MKSLAIRQAASSGYLNMIAAVLIGSVPLAAIAQEKPKPAAKPPAAKPAAAAGRGGAAAPAAGRGGSTNTASPGRGGSTPGAGRGATATSPGCGGATGGRGGESRPGPAGPRHIPAAVGPRRIQASGRASAVSTERATCVREKVSPMERTEKRSGEVRMAKSAMSTRAAWISTTDRVENERLCESAQTTRGLYPTGMAMDISRDRMHTAV